MENKNNIRLRFAPSPTGFLHIGNLRSALFGYLLSKSLGGDFLLRIEDTDQKREVEGAVESLIKIMDWVGIKFDEGPHLPGKFGPYVQTQRLNIYNEHSEKLLKEGKAYRCFCTEQRLTEMREKQQAEKLPPRYDRACRSLSIEESDTRAKNGEAYVIRQKMPLEGEVKVYDELRGEISFKNSDLDDHVLIKSNGIPTYHFASVIDDHLMEISHVTRGDEWLPSFPKNILLYKAFDWTPPKFIHLPLILNKGGGKLSKRQGDVFVEDYRQKGYLPEAIINFCALLGWHPKTEQEIFTLTELVQEFSVDGMGISPAVFDLDKLNYYNGYYIREKTDEELAILCRPYLEENGINTEKIDLNKVMKVSRDRLKTLADISSLAHYFFQEPRYEEALLAWKDVSFEKAKDNIKELEVILENIQENDWTKEHLEEEVFMYLKTNDKKNGDYLWPWRVCLSGEKNSPSPFEIAWVLGKQGTLDRMKKIS